MSFADAAYQILKNVGNPLSVNEITSLSLKQGLISTNGKTPFATMGARLYVDVKRKGVESKFVKVNRGRFALRECSQAPTTSASAFRPSTFKGAAYMVLQGENRPLRIDDITSIALKRGLLRTAGKTPNATMGAQLYTDIKTKKEKSIFVQLAKNRFGLREWGLEVIEDEINKAESEKVLPATERKRSIVGDPINFEGLIYGPLNENGVIFLFSKVHDKLGINIEAIQPGFPDAKGRRKVRKGWEDIWIEFEFKSSQFKVHGHDPKGCDAIICWEHDWKDCPIEVIELKSKIEELKTD
ncbi:MAG: winged helix-turn-helix domain-containing protein [Dehalococcoidales bacterium]|nr:winged helix-turn-helix domain-containing protein [Dehalococcoidales bacterium]